jgi:hypothetical protein
MEQEMPKLWAQAEPGTNKRRMDPHSLILVSFESERKENRRKEDRKSGKKKRKVTGFASGRMEIKL